ncbi:hypothetical protein CHX26_05595 [Porphyrobacter sp. HT-58-2]|uniref:hypothetical protein n=1 Tax=Porphyrobacter sp. HT-58-2 TaxID=2023229 RepID=UPI000CDBE022|nr:hypothetical protein [Porphyrobacter sp. HT-58-2]AUX69043.1 hypothetical protein CHX26_05595 [Porphyrobacter sp. HT-58-2]
MIRPALFSLAALLASAGAAHASTAAEAEAEAPEELGEIIVEGQTEKEVREFLWRAITPVSGRKVARRDGPVCMVFDDINAELEAALRARIAETLAAIGNELAAPGCTPNATVAFPRGAPAFVRWLEDEQPKVFGSLYGAELRRFTRTPRVAYNWHYLPEKADQIERQRNNSVAFFRADENAGGLAGQIGTPAIARSFTVIDASAIDGLTVNQLADYITMQAMVMLEPEVRDEVPASSILRLFDQQGSNPAAAEELSQVDRVMLGVIYRKGRGSFTPSAIRAEVARELAKGGAASK